MNLQAIWNIYKPVWTPALIISGIVLGALLLSMLSFLCAKKKYSFGRLFMAMALYGYIYLVLASTVFSRSSYGYYNANTELFWSYRYTMQNQSVAMAMQIFLNMLLLIPAGFLFPFAVPRAKFWQSFLFGLGCTVTIEVLQLVLQRGLFEWDDILHNVLGFCVGYLTYYVLKSIGKWIVKWKNKMA